MLHRRTLAVELLKRFDWIGFFLYSGGLFMFLLGLVWGATLHPWKSGYVIGTVIAGGLTFACFILWEIYLPIKNAEPFLPLRLLKNVRYMACTWLTAVGAATYYGFSLIWPNTVSVLYPGLSDSYRGTIYGCVVMGFVFGQIVG